MHHYNHQCIQAHKRIRLTALCALLASTILFIYASSVCCNRYTNPKLLGKNHLDEAMINMLQGEN
jgi:hypothetical protein